MEGGGAGNTQSLKIKSHRSAHWACMYAEERARAKEGTCMSECVPVRGSDGVCVQLSRLVS